MWWQELEKFREAKAEETYQELLNDSRRIVAAPASNRGPPATALAPGIEKKKVEPKKRDRRTIEEVQAVRPRPFGLLTPGFSRLVCVV